MKLVSEYSADTTVDEMDTVTFGSYPEVDASGNTNEPLEWIVLEKSNAKALLLSKYILTSHTYNDENIDVTWENCTMRKWLNSEYINKIFTKNEQESILTTEVINRDNARYGTKGGNNTKDNLFLLSPDETNKYFISDTQRMAKYNKYQNHNAPHGHFLRGPGYRQNYAAAQRHDGKINDDDMGQNVAHDWHVRPALWISAEGVGLLDNNVSNIDVNNNDNDGIGLAGLPSRESELRSDNHFYLDNNMQKNSWVYYKTYYYHVDGVGNI